MTMTATPGMHAPSRFRDRSARALRVLHGIREAECRSVDTLLGLVGKQGRPGVLGPVLWFAAGTVTAGAVAAGALAYLVTPASGEKLRRGIVRFLDGDFEPLAPAGG